MRLECRDVSVSYGRDRAITWPLRDVSFVVDGRTLAITGPSGSGKSTLLRVLSGRQRPASGQVILGESPVEFQSRRGPGDPRVALVHQDYRLIPFLSVSDNLRFAAEMQRIKCTEGDIARLLALVGMDGSQMRDPATLSGGEQQRVAIARALAARPAVLVADEPTGALDAENTSRVADVFNQINIEHGVTVVVATHDPLVAHAMTECRELAGGRLATNAVDVS